MTRNHEKIFLQRERHSNVLRQENQSEWVTDQEQELKCLEFQKHKVFSCLLRAFSVEPGEQGLSLVYKATHCRRSLPRPPEKL